MRRLPVLGIIMLLCAFLAGCQEQKTRVEEGDNPDANTEAFQVHPPVRVDTVVLAHTPTRITRKIRQTADGGLLFAAFTDILKYQGSAFIPFPKPDSLDSFDAFDVLEDASGHTWIASTHYGLFRYDGQTYVHLTTADGLAHNRTMDLYQDKAGDLWIATMGGASRYDGKDFRTFTTEDGLTNNDINVIIEDRTGKIWFGTRGGVSVYDPTSSTFKEIFDHMGRPLKNIRNIIAGKDGQIWLGGEHGIWRYKNGTTAPVSGVAPNSLMEDSRGNLWLTYGSTLAVIPKESLKQTKVSQMDIFTGKGMFFGLCEDQTGAIWVGTIRGVLSYDDEAVRVYVDK